MQKPFPSSVDNPYGSKSHVPYRGQPHPCTILMDLNVQCLFGKVNTNRNEFRITANTLCIHAHLISSLNWGFLVKLIHSFYRIVSPPPSIPYLIFTIQYSMENIFWLGTGKSDFRYIMISRFPYKDKKIWYPKN